MRMMEKFLMTPSRTSSRSFKKASIAGSRYRSVNSVFNNCACAQAPSMIKGRHREKCKIRELWNNDRGFERKLQANATESNYSSRRTFASSWSAQASVRRTGNLESLTSCSKHSCSSATHATAQRQIKQQQKHDQTLSTLGCKIENQLRIARRKAHCRDTTPATKQIEAHRPIAQRR